MNIYRVDKTETTARIDIRFQIIVDHISHSIKRSLYYVEWSLDGSRCALSVNNECMLGLLSALKCVIAIFAITT